MPSQPPARHGRFDAYVVARRVESMRVACKLTATQVAEAIGIARTAYSKKCRLEASSFTNEELGRLADFFSKQTGRLLIGWPFVDEAMSALLESHRR